MKISVLEVLITSWVTLKFHKAGYQFKNSLACLQVFSFEP